MEMEYERGVVVVVAVGDHDDNRNIYVWSCSNSRESCSAKALKACETETWIKL
jgi:hypothetical protein